MFDVLADGVLLPTDVLEGHFQLLEIRGLYRIIGAKNVFIFELGNNIIGCSLSM